MKISNRFVRSSVAIGAASLLATQISLTGNVALAQTGCGDSGSSSGGGAAVAGLAGAGLLVALLSGGGGAATAAGAGLAATAAAGSISALIASGELGGGYSIIAELFSGVSLSDLGVGDKPFTFFAPTDEAMTAYDKAHPGFIAGLRKDKAARIKFLQGHIVEGAYDAETLTAGVEGTSYTTKAGTKIKVGGLGGLTVNGGKAVTTDIKASNGIIHTIDTVLVPNEG